MYAASSYRQLYPAFGSISPPGTRYAYSGGSLRPDWSLEPGDLEVVSGWSSLAGFLFVLMLGQ